MTLAELKTIIKKGENAKVDFKSEWYKYTEAKKPKINNEFVRDMFALANGDIHSTDKTSYLIIGIMDDNDTRENDKVISIEDIDNKIYDFDKSKMLFLNKFTQQLLDTLNNYAQPEFLALDIEWYEIEEDKKILVLAIPPHNRLISLSQDLRLDSTTDKKGTVYYRIGENVRVASAEVIEDFRKAFNRSDNLENPFFKKSNKSKKIEEYPFYRNIEEDKYICQKGKISVEANLPKVNFPMSFLIDCEITFRLENNRIVVVKLDNEATLKELFSMYMFEEKNEEDNKIVTYESDNLALEISIGTFNTLIKIANDLQEVYTNRIIQLETKLESKGFDISKKYKNGFELCEISYKLWIKIQQFIRKHIMCDTSNRGEWDIFTDSNATYFIWTYTTVINHSIKYQYSYHLDVKEPIRIVLVWDMLNFISNYHRDDERKILTIKESYTWLTEKLIETIKDEMIGDIEIYSRDKYDSIMDEYFNIIPLYHKSDEEYKNKEFVAITKIVDSFYLFKHIIALNKDNLKILYESLIFLLENSKSLDIFRLNKLFYHIGNINTIPVYLKDTKISNPTKEYFINRINLELEEIKKGDMSMKELIGDSTYALEEIFNCYTVIFDTNGEDDYPSIVIIQLYQKLKYFEKISNVFSVREKMMMPL